MSLVEYYSMGDLIVCPVRLLVHPVKLAEQELADMFLSAIANLN